METLSLQLTARWRALRAAWLALAGLVVLALPAATARGQVFPPGFNDELVTSGLSVPTSLLWLPDGHLFIAEQSGEIRVYENGLLLPAPALTLAVEDFDEQGLLGLAAHPDYPTPPYLYVFYTPFTGNQEGNTNRVSRFLVDDHTVVASSEVVLLDGIDAGQAFHLGGCMRFASDGTLFIATGDTGWNSVLPQDLGSLAGKLLRIHPDGSIPADNPFVGVPGARPEIYQWGLRNPFRFSLQPGTDIPFIGDVGFGLWEEVNTGPPGANFGWPDCEGSCSKPAFTNPLYEYDHSQGSSAIVGNLFYQGTQFPAEFVGDFLFFDHALGHLGRIQLNGSNQITSVEFPFLETASQGWLSGPVDLVEGPDGSIYYCTYSPGQVRRIFYTGSGNRNPTAVATADVTAGYKPLSVAFRGSDSFDVDGDGLDYQWDFDDGSSGSTQADPVHVFTSNGNHDVRLTVSDGNGGTATSEPIVVTVGNLPPVPLIQVPGDSTSFLVGQTIFFSGAAFDYEDGAIDPSQLHWRVDLHHLQHIHPVILDQTGAGGSFPSSDHGEDPADIFFRIHLRAEDSTGLSAATSVDVLPELSPPASIQVTSAVAADDRDATSVHDDVRISGYDPVLEPFDFVGNDVDQESAAMQFSLNVPPGAQIVDARIVVRAAPLQNASSTGALSIHLYDVADAAPFVDGPFGDLIGHHPTASLTVPWQQTTNWVAGQEYSSPSVAPLVQRFVDRSDYQTGNFIGFVVTEGTTAAGTYYGWMDFFEGGPPTRLDVEYRVLPVSAEGPDAAGSQWLPVAPNPFQSSTMVQFRLGRAGPVTVGIYDAAGRRVRTLLDGQRQAGDHQVVWDGRTQGGSEAPSGVYFVRMETGEVVRTGRVVLLR